MQSFSPPDQVVKQILYYHVLQRKGGTSPASNLPKVIHPIIDNLVFEPRQCGSRV